MNQTLGDLVVQSLEEFLTKLANSVFDFIGEQVSGLVDLIVTTPRPNSVLSQPSNGAWPDIYTYHWETIVPLSLLLWALMLGLVIFLESTSHLFSGYHRTKLKKRAFSGLLGILSWWWLAAISLRFVDGLTGFLVPNLETVGLFETVSFAAMGVSGLTLAATLDILIFAVLALIYLVRQVILYLYVLLMPLLIVFWVPGIGPFAHLARLMSRMAGFYVPFLFMTVPIALLFRLGSLLGESVTVSLGGFGQWILAISTPLIALILPFVLFWQAGALFFMADRAAQHSSRHRAHARKNTVQRTGEQGTLGLKNLRRGLAGQSAVKASGQSVLGSGSSTAHTVGTKLSRTKRTLQSRVESSTDSTHERSRSKEVTQSRTRNEQSGESASESSEGTDGSTSEPPSESESTETDNTTSESDTSSDDTDSDDDEDHPRYIY